jgi:FkbM family methyltransferase
VITEKVLELLKPNDIVIDAGWFVDRLLCAIICKASIVIAIEVSSNNVRRTHENVALNQFQNIEISNCGIGKKHDLGKVKPGVGSSMNQVVENKGDETEPVTVESLDNIVLQQKYHKVNLVIIDIEGYEYFCVTRNEANSIRTSR